MACGTIPTDVYAVIDLYGQCAQVALIHRPLQAIGIPEGASSPGGKLQEYLTYLLLCSHVVKIVIFGKHLNFVICFCKCKNFDQFYSAFSGS